jgi:flagellar M-ring protein FliF
MANEMTTMQGGGLAGFGAGMPPFVRQLGMLAAIAAAVALGVAAVLWSQEPNYSLLYGDLSSKDSAQVLDALSKSGIPFKIDPSNGAILVPAKQVYEARLKLANDGLPRGNSVGFELMDDKPAFGVTQLQEAARYQRAIEGELARSISTLSTVKSARVMLAIPKQSVFIREENKASASVIVNLYPGRSLDEGQVDAIVHLVSSSVPGLAPGRVTVVDQQGRLLTTDDSTRDLTQPSNQLDYKRRLESDYAARVEEILTPVVGPGAVRAQVVADVDYTQSEQTSEKYSPDHNPVRSEQVSEDVRTGAAGAQGIPGALSNEPPGTATAPEVAKAAPANGSAPAKGKTGAAPATVAPAVPVDTNKRATRNYEIDKTISHTKQATGTIRRLTVAVVVDDIVTVDKRGRVHHRPRSKQEIDQFIALTKEAVGFDAQRGDSVSVVNVPFSAPPAEAPLPTVPFWKQDWFLDLAKQVGGGIAALVVLMFLVRPLLRGLTAARPAGTAMLGGPEPAPDRVMLSNLPGGYDQQLAAAKQVAAQDPKRVAQVVKSWVGRDA